MKKLPMLAWLLGLAGAIPFIVLAFSFTRQGVMFGLLPGQRLYLMLTYAAVIISFIGAVHWGVALVHEDDNNPARYLYGVVPALLAWTILIVPVDNATRLLALAAVVILAWIADRALLFGCVSDGYARLRLVLTTIVSASLILAAIPL